MKKATSIRVFISNIFEKINCNAERKIFKITKRILALSNKMKKLLT